MNKFSGERVIQFFKKNRGILIITLIWLAYLVLQYILKIPIYYHDRGQLDLVAQMINNGLKPYTDFYLDHHPIVYYLHALYQKLGFSDTLIDYLEILLGSISIYFVYSIYKYLIKNEWISILGTITYVFSPAILTCYLPISLEPYYVTFFIIGFYFFINKSYSPIWAGLVFSLAFFTKSPVLFVLILTYVVYYIMNRSYRKRILKSSFIFIILSSFFLIFCTFYFDNFFRLNYISHFTSGESELVKATVTCRLDYFFNLLLSNFIPFGIGFFLSFYYLFKKSSRIKEIAVIALILYISMGLLYETLTLHHNIQTFLFSTIIFCWFLKDYFLSIIKKNSKWKYAMGIFLISIYLGTFLNIVIPRIRSKENSSKIIGDQISFLANREERVVYSTHPTVITLSGKDTIDWYYVLAPVFAYRDNIDKEIIYEKISQADLIVLHDDKFLNDINPLGDDVTDRVKRDRKVIYSDYYVNIYK